MTHKVVFAENGILMHSEFDPAACVSQTQAITAPKIRDFDTSLRGGMEEGSLVSGSDRAHSSTVSIHALLSLRF